MFGMLDYRAHKLLWLLLWPISLLNMVISYAVVAAVAVIVVYEFPRYQPLMKVAIAWLIAQVAGRSWSPLVGVYFAKLSDAFSPCRRCRAERR
jgi:hypothetical protein